jgi:preprotein translocase subunit YajC
MSGVIIIIAALVILAIFFFAMKSGSNAKEQQESTVPFANTPTEVLQNHLFALARKQSKLSKQIADITADFRASDTVVRHGERLRAESLLLDVEFDAARTELNKRSDRII